MANGPIVLCLGQACAPYTFEEQQKKLEALKEELIDTKEKLKELEQQENGSAVFTNDARQWIDDARDTLRTAEGLDTLRMAESLLSLERSIGATCLCGSLPNCRRRRAAKGLIQNQLEKVEKLNKSYMPGVKGYRLSDNNFVQTTRVGDIQNIWNCISENDGCKVVCIHGIPGVGKTAVAEAVHNKALLDNQEKFSCVVFLKAEYGITLKSLQEKIMRYLSIKPTDTVDNIDRARKIHDELVRRKKCLIIIDFLWEDFTLRDIGIPDDDVKADGEVIKVILTSRSRLRCPRIHKDIYIEIKPVTDSWTCYEKNLGPTFSETEGEAKDLVKKAVEGCNGLPAAIIELAHKVRGMLDQSLDEIASSLKEMLSSRTYSEPSPDAKFKVLECSYNKLDNTSQQCFLYCALYPKGFPIKVGQLIDNWIWEGLLDSYIGTLEDKRKKGRNVLTVLKMARLLENADSYAGEEAVKMLNLLHDMAVNILFAHQLGVYINSGNDLTEFPPIDDPNGNIKRASFMYNKLGVLKNQPNCPKLSTLLLQHNPFHYFPDNFFTKIPNLTLLDLSYTYIYNLPSSIRNLKFLQVLRLQYCLNLTSLPPLSNLKELIVLNLFGTPITKLPVGMERLKKLKRLDLSYTMLAEFPAGLVGELESLQELLLLMNDAEAYRWRSKQSRLNSKEAYVEELSCLERLKILQLNFLSKEDLYEYLKAIPRIMPRPRYKFCVGGFNTDGNLGVNSIAFVDEYPVNYKLSYGISELYLNACRCSLRPFSTLEKTGIDFQNLKVLNLYYCSSVTYLFSLKMLQCLQNLERVHVRQCWSISGIIEPASVSSTGSHATTSCRLLKLQELVLIDLPMLESIYPGQTELDWPAFRRFSIWDCNKLNMLPSILLGIDPKRVIKVRGKSFKLDKHYEHEEAEVPDKIVSFVSLVPNNDQANYFKRTEREEKRSATMLRSDGIEAHPQSPSQVAHRKNYAPKLFRIVQRHIGVLFDYKFAGGAPLKEAL